MKDIPLFTTENGAASLILREIPYTNTAYVRILSSESVTALTEECVSFCRAVGAEQVYGTGHESLAFYPLHTAVIAMRADRENIGQTDAALFPAQEQTLSRWLELYRQKARHIPNAAWMTDADGQEMLKAGDGYFVHRDGKLLGIGRVSGGKLLFLAAFEKGAGADVVKALCHAITEDTVSLEVASANQKAVSLYESLGFIPAKELSRWYKIF